MLTVGLLLSLFSQLFSRLWTFFLLEIMRAPTRSRLWLFLQRVNLKEIEMLLVVPSKFDYVMTDDICVRDQISTALEYS